MQDSKYVSDLASPIGAFEIWVKPKGDSTWHLTRQVMNLIPNAGKAALAEIQIGEGTAPSHIAIGTNSTAATLLDTNLPGEVLRSAATRTRITTVATNDTAQYSVDIAIATSYTIYEAGLFNNAVAGSLYSRQVFAGVAVVSGDYFRVVWKFVN